MMAPDYVELYSLKFAYGKSPSITVLLTVDYSNFSTPVNVTLNKMAWFTEGELQSIDMSQTSKSVLTIQEVNLLENLKADARRIFLDYPRLMDIMQQVSDEELERIVNESQPKLALVQ